MAQAYKSIYNFAGDGSGAFPLSTLTLDKQGNLYGVTYEGGSVGGYCFVLGCGVVYKVAPDGRQTVLVTFTAEANGAYPRGPLTLVGQTLYGSASGFGPQGDGVLFTVRTDGSGFKLLHSFSGQDGVQPLGPLIPAPRGGFYGITANGGPTLKHADAGVLFKIMPDGTYTRLHNFTGGNDGANPVTLAIDSSGTLYGSTAEGAACKSGCGVVFKFEPSTATFTVLSQFTSSLGLFPMVGSIGPDGTVYGATNQGGTGNGGTLFDLVPSLNGPYMLNTLYSFGENHPVVDPGSSPQSGPLLTESGALIGTTFSGNESLYKFKFGNMTVLHSFPSQTEAGPPVIGRDTLIYGVGSQGGLNPCTVYGTSIFAGCGFVYSLDRQQVPNGE